MATTFIYTTELGCSEIDLEITYSVFGKYRPSTRTDPEEFPEMEIEAVEYKGKDLYWMLDLINEEVQEAAWENRKKEEADAAADYGAWLYEVRRDALLDARL
jgi:uncharacterized protein (DUF427 family)